MINKILVPVDGSEISMRALKFAVELGRNFHSEIVVLNVDIPYDLSRIKPPVKDKEGKVIESAQLSPLDMAKREAQKTGYDRFAFKKYVDIDPADKICDVAKTIDADLIVMGNRGMGVLAGFFLGSVSTKVSQSAHCPVTIVK
jgi:nucleotide-binding universal stress UspA family protein